MDEDHKPKQGEPRDGTREAVERLGADMLANMPDNPEFDRMLGSDASDDVAGEK